MYLQDYIPKLSKKYRKIFFSGISFDSSKVKKNYIFFAIKGNRFDGNNFIEKAIKKGARVIISEKKFLKRNDNVIFIQTTNVRKLLSEVSFKFLKLKPKKFIAVTGTNGKSSIADFYYQILNLNLEKVASIGTIGLRYKDKKRSLLNTTIDPIQLSSILSFLKKRKIENVILEASSHGLKQNRLDGLLFNIGIFTNLSHDHLDYHKTMKDYLNSKLYLFKKLIKKGGCIITDTTIPEYRKIKNISIKKKTNLKLIFNKKGIDLISHKFVNEKQILEVRFNHKKYSFELNLIGKVQIKNILMSILASHESGLEFRKILNVMHKIKSVDGRLEKVGNIKNKSKVILDYAHTPEALELALLNLKEQFPKSKINLVFGCGGDRDKKKRSFMGKIAEKYSDKIFLTDDNPRYENPNKIRRDIKIGIKNVIIDEIPNRKHAIDKAIHDLKTGDLLLVAGKGHEKIQDYGNKKLFFSDRRVILDSIKIKNRYLSDNLKLNIIKEQSNKSISKNLTLKNISINSKTIKKNDVFFAIKGKKMDGNNFVTEAFKKKASLAIVNRLTKNLPLSKQIKVNNTLNFLTNCSKIFRENLNNKIIAITGSCGKTTLKEMLGSTLNKVSKTSYSHKSFNNKYGVPISLLNLKQNDDFGVLEVGMDKKGEIDSLSQIIKPDVGIITNISYAHSKNFKNISGIASAKAEIIKNIRTNGIIILNGDDKFFNFHKKIALKRKLKVLSFGINSKSLSTKLTRIKKLNDKYKLFVKLENQKYFFYSKNNNKSNIYNILATLTLVNIYKDLNKINKNIFLYFKSPEGRGDFSKIKLNNKKITLVDETYNSNPLSLKTAIENFDKIEKEDSKKYLILGDMLELGKHSIKQHRLISKVLNNSGIHKVYVYGKYIKETFKNLKKNKKAKILTTKLQIIDLIKKDLNNNDYLMIKGSNATGLHKITKILKQSN
ncbi:UDP-N-acetylmuramoyl-L-alanyl-D-glutamate--2,6-diaminopimelate ligase [Candidatus Pelagibacter sp.]|nr:UDP-N-acetylmuramoyl-L-alanyl-D-glutamate--2,6-diaminopimelate ligase [Candidatus Pelagibacter sp.]